MLTIFTENQSMEMSCRIFVCTVLFLDLAMLHFSLPHRQIGGKGSWLRSFI